jgi:hypothetical protein
MDDFSKSIAATTSSALSGEAQATAAKIQKAVTAGVVGDGALQARLSGLSARLQVFRLHADQLSRCIADAPVVHPNLGDVLKSSLAESAHALRTVTGRLEPGSDSLDSHAVSAFEALLAAYTRLFVLGTQLLTMWVLPPQRYLRITRSILCPNY